MRSQKAQFCNKFTLRFSVFAGQNSLTLNCKTKKLSEQSSESFSYLCLLFQCFCKAVLEGNNAVESAALAVLAIIAHTDKLEAFAFLGISQRRLELAAGQLLERIRIEVIQIIRTLRYVINVLEGEQIIVQIQVRIDGVLGRYQ